MVGIEKEKGDGIPPQNRPLDQDQNLALASQEDVATDEGRLLPPILQAVLEVEVEGGEGDIQPGLDLHEVNRQKGGEEDDQDVELNRDQCQDRGQVQSPTEEEEGVGEVVGAAEVGVDTVLDPDHKGKKEGGEGVPGLPLLQLRLLKLRPREEKDLRALTVR